MSIAVSLLSPFVCFFLFLSLALFLSFTLPRSPFLLSLARSLVCDCIHRHFFDMILCFHLAACCQVFDAPLSLPLTVRNRLCPFYICLSAMFEHRHAVPTVPSLLLLSVFCSHCFSALFLPHCCQLYCFPCAVSLPPAPLSVTIALHRAAFAFC